MRLTCPRCGAQYEIANAAIPAAGREVECSACSHVWFQPGQAKAAQTDGAPYDPEARPALNRPLNESILSILREETARELQARQGGPRQSDDDKPQADKPAASTDQNIATAAVDTAPDTQPTNLPDAQPDPQPEPRPETPVETQPVPEVPIHIAAFHADEIEFVEHPPAKEPARPAAAHGDAPHENAHQPPHEPAPEPATALPDAAELAATLTRGGPAAASTAAAGLAAAATAAATADTAPQDAPATALLPVAKAAKRGSGYASGFGLAAMLALGIVTVYALAQRVPADEGGGVLAELRQDIDRGRLWLHDRIIGE